MCRPFIKITFILNEIVDINIEKKLHLDLAESKCYIGGENETFIGF